jgi:hypothetical protein
MLGLPGAGALFGQPIRYVLRHQHHRSSTNNGALLDTIEMTNMPLLINNLRNAGDLLYRFRRIVVSSYHLRAACARTPAFLPKPSAFTPNYTPRKCIYNGMEVLDDARS